MNRPLQGGWGSSPHTSQPPGARAPLGHNCPQTPWQSCLASTHWTPDRTGLPNSLQHPCLRPEQHRRTKRPPASGSREASTRPIPSPPVSLLAFSVCPHGLFSPSAWRWVQHLDLDQQVMGAHRQGLQQARRVPRRAPQLFRSSRCRSKRRHARLQLRRHLPELSPLVTAKPSTCRRLRA